MLTFDTVFYIPIDPFIEPVFKPFFIGAGLHKILHFHLFEFATAENEVAGGDFVAERFSLLRDAEGELPAGGLQHIIKVDKHALCRFRSQVYNIGTVFHRPDEGLKHQVELPFCGQFPAASRAFLLRQFIGAKSLMAAFTFYQRVGKTLQMAAGHPDFRMHQNTGFDADHIVPFLHHRAPPRLFDVAFQFYAQRAVIPAAG